MLKNKLVLCIGNNTTHTDTLATKYAEMHGSTNYGLINSVDADINEVGFYHSSFADFDDVTNFLTLIQNFEHVIFFKQPKETYDDITAYNLTKHAVELTKHRLQIPVEEIDAEKT